MKVDTHFQEFGVDTITFAGNLEGKLQATLDAGFTQIMLKASDIVGHGQGIAAAVALVKASGLRVTGFQVLRDFEGLSGDLHDYKVDIAKAMLQMAKDVGAPLLLACSSTSAHATSDLDTIAADLRKLAMLALPMGIKIAYEGLSWGKTINEYTTAWDVVCRADMPNLGTCLDSFHILAAKTTLDEIDFIDPEKIYLVQLADFLWQETNSFEERMATARTYRVFPGEGVHNDAVIEIVQRINKLGYLGDYSFEVFNDDYQNLPLQVVAQRAKKSAVWLAEQVLERTTPLPNQMRLRR
ncbi:MAG: sugar phosphate isomerase/epimerase family protein [Cytophagales bacterium]|nr:sugar phosphate isomerase/epimerase family protein [Cytophagales bacterium]